MPSVSRRVLFVIALLALSSAVQAQTIAGTVKDATGAVMPGVTVEAASPALIEKVRSVVTDGAGQYKIVDLRPGTYTVTFSLPGFATVKREGIELTTDFTANVNAELKVGARRGNDHRVGRVAARRRADRVHADACSRATSSTRCRRLTTSRRRPCSSPASRAPAARRPAAATSAATRCCSSRRRPSTAPTQSMQLWDGFRLSNVQGTGTGGAHQLLRERQRHAGTELHDGRRFDRHADQRHRRQHDSEGRRQPFHGLLFGDFTYAPWSASNLTPALQARGLTNVAKVYHISDFNPGFGGPITKDNCGSTPRSATRRSTSRSSTATTTRTRGRMSMSRIRPAGPRRRQHPERVGAADVAGEPERQDSGLVHQPEQDSESLQPHHGDRARRAGAQKTPYAHATTVTWQRTQTSKLLLEAGFAVGHTSTRNSTGRRTRGLVAYNDISSGLCYNNYCPGHSEHYGAHGGLQGVRRTYVTGSHALKAGIDVGHGADEPADRLHRRRDDELQQRRAAVGVAAHPDQPVGRLLPDLGIYAQDRWTFKRATITGGLRYDYFDGDVARLDAASQPLESVAVLHRASRSSTGRICRRASASPTTCSATARRR